MENNILDLVREFNSDTNRPEFSLQYTNDGFTQGVQFPQTWVFDDDNSSTEHARPKTLSNLLIMSSYINSRAREMIEAELQKFFLEKKKQLEEKFTDAKLKLVFNFNNSAEVFISGRYNEDIMFDFVDVMEEDFKYIFEGLTIKTEY